MMLVALASERLLGPEDVSAYGEQALSCST